MWERTYIRPESGQSATSFGEIMPYLLDTIVVMRALRKGSADTNQRFARGTPKASMLRFGGAVSVSTLEKFYGI